ncbi:hypothetical protein HYU23_04510 [Candidatus Woesearchaeota archaeon]|nr:hypothetical protein [Candidatus Woesearchaeota archaeon]
MKNKRKIKSIVIGIIAALAIFIILGAVTVLIPNKFYIRMTPIHFYDYIFLVFTSILSGVYIGLWHYTRNTVSKCSYAATGGAIGGFFSFGCALCNKLLIFILGTSAVALYFIPIQLYLGVLSMILLGYAVYKQHKFLSMGALG